MLSLSFLLKPIADRAFAKSIVWLKNSDHVVVSHSPEEFLDETAGSLAYFSAFEIKYSGVVGVDIGLSMYPDYIKFKLQFQKFCLGQNKFILRKNAIFSHFC